MPEAVVATIEKVDPIKSGEKDGRRWTLYRVTAGGQQFSTFNADWQKAIGQERTIEFTSEEVTRDGRVYTNRRIVDPKPQGERFSADLKSIHAKLDRILEILEKRS